VDETEADADDHPAAFEVPTDGATSGDPQTY